MGIDIFELAIWVYVCVFDIVRYQVATNESR